MSVASQRLNKLRVLLLLSIGIDANQHVTWRVVHSVLIGLMTLSKYCGNDWLEVLHFTSSSQPPPPQSHSAAKQQARTLKMVLIGVPFAESQITIMESGPASAVAIQRLSSLTQQHVIGLH